MAFSDNFNRADANLEASGDWTHDGQITGALAIVSNQLRCTTTDSSGSAYKCPDQGSADHYVEYTLENLTGSGGPFVCCRLADRGNFLGTRYNGVSGASEVYRRVGGALTKLGDIASPDPIIGGAYRLECEGQTWRLFLNGVSIGTGDIGHVSLTSTRQGLVGRVLALNPWIDNFAAGSLVAPPAGGSAPCGVSFGLGFYL